MCKLLTLARQKCMTFALAKALSIASQLQVPPKYVRQSSFQSLPYYASFMIGVVNLHPVYGEKVQ